MTKADKKSSTNGLKAFFQSELVSFVTGVLLAGFGLYAAVAVVSFLLTGSQDYNLLYQETNGLYANLCGANGAAIANFLVNKGFGVPIFFLLYFLFSAGRRILLKKPLKPLIRLFFICFCSMVWLSLLFGYLLPRLPQIDYIRIGGMHGEAASQWLIFKIGHVGLILTLAISALVFSVLAFASTLPRLKRLNERLHGQKDNITESESEPEQKQGLASNLSPEPEPELEPVPEPKPEPEPIQEPESVIVPEPAPLSVAEPVLEPAPISPSDKTDVEMEINVPEQTELVDKPLSEQLVEKYGKCDPTQELPHYRLPGFDLLKKVDINTSIDNTEQELNKQRIVDTLHSYGIEIKEIKATIGPTITLYEIIPVDGTRIARIRNLGDDIAMSIAAIGIRIIAPMPGKGTIGIEVPNRRPQIVSMHSVLASKKFQETTMDLPVALGKTITDEVFMVDLCKLPHLLVAGATGQGKSVGLNAIITSLLYKKHPSQLKLVLVDPKKTEFSIYSEIDHHYLAKLEENEDAVITDVDKVIRTLQSVCKEMDDRNDLLKKAHVRNIKEYNEKYINRQLNPEHGHRYLPYMVVILDEYGDLIVTAGKEVETPIARIAAVARAAGIHMVIATQRPSANVVTGLIKANFPARMAFKVASMVDSRTILDQSGANQLIGRGDLLFLQGSELTRVQCAFIDTPEVQNVCKYISEQQGYREVFALPEVTSSESSDGDTFLKGNDSSQRDMLFEEAARLVVINQQGSTSMIQRRFSIGFNRAGRIMDQLSNAGVVGPADGSKPRPVLISDEVQLERLLQNLNN